MKIVIVNGSPRGQKSNSIRLSRAFVEGLGRVCPVECEELTLSEMNIEPCIGCLNCWKRTPGKCFKTDDAGPAIEKVMQADLVIWSFGLYYYSLPGILKNFLDRQVQTRLPIMKDRTDGKGNGIHTSRYDTSKQRHMLISTCGFYTYKGNYESVKDQFDYMLGVANYTTLFCGEGEMFPVPYLKERVETYLGYVAEAGEDYGRYGTILPATREKLDELLMPKEEFEKAGNSYYEHCARKAKEREEAARKAAEEAKETPAG